MATITPSLTKVGGDDNAILFTWALTSADHTGIGAEFIQHTDLCFQAVGSNWGGAVAAAEGSNDGTNWFALTNASGGAAITFSAADGGKQAIERPRYIRPRLSTVGTLAIVSLSLMARKNPR